MVRITVPSDFEETLVDLKRPVELCTNDGRVLGRFLPEGALFLTVEEARRLNLCPFSDEEIATAAAEPMEGRPLAEILRDLEQR